MKKYCLDLSTHEYHIRCNGLCTLQATSTPFPKLNYLSPLCSLRSVFVPLLARISFRIISNRLTLLHCANSCKFLATAVQSLGAVIIKLRGKLRAARCSRRCVEIPPCPSSILDSAVRVTKEAVRYDSLCKLLRK